MEGERLENGVEKEGGDSVEEYFPGDEEGRVTVAELAEDEAVESP